MDKTTKRNKIIEFVCKHYEISKDILKEPDRKTALPRHICAYYLRHYVGMSYKKIAPLTGYVEHSAVIYGSDKIKKQIEQKIEPVISFHKAMLTYMGNGFVEDETVTVQSNRYACSRFYTPEDEARDRALVEGWKNGSRKIGIKEKHMI